MTQSPSPRTATISPLVEAIERRDPEEAARIHRQHRIGAGKMLVDLLRGGFTQL